MTDARRVLAPPRPSSAPAGADWRGAVLWALLVAAAVGVGTWWVDRSGAQLRAAPLYGRWDWHPGWGLVPAVVIGMAGVVWGPRVAARCRWRLVPLAAGGWSVVWALALAASDGWDAVTAPLTSRHEYEPFAAGIDDLGAFVRTYADELPAHPIHVQGHPPGPVVVAWLLDRAGLAGAGWLAVVVLVAWGAAIAAALVAARLVAGEPAARRAAPALALLPAALWSATTLDALFTFLTVLATATLLLAATRRSTPWGVVAGFVAGVALLCTYGAGAALVPGVLVALLVGCTPRVWGAVAVGVAVPVAVAAAAGFWWIDGLTATGERYWAGVASGRPALYLTFLGNPAALAVATGPAVAAGLWAARRRGGREVWLPVAALAAVALADLTQMSRGEVERIWLPFVPWLALAAPGHRRGWLAAQVGVAVAVRSTLISPW